MHIFKKIIRGLSTFFLPLLLLLTTATAITSMTAGRSSTVKGWLDDSGVYEQIPDLALQELSKNPEGGESFTKPEVKSALKDVLKPELLQSWSENFIDATYRWLEGKVDTPDFNLDLTPLRQGISNFIRSHLSGLPVCDKNSRPPDDEDDVLALTCLPRGTDINARVSAAEQQLFSGDGPFSQTVINAESLRNKETGKNPFEDKFAAFPDVYQAVMKLPFILGLLTILAGTAMVWLYEQKSQAWRKIARTFLSVGLILLVGGALALFLFSQPNKPAGEAKDFMEAIGMPLVRATVTSVSRIQVWFGAVYTVIAIAAYIWLKKVAPKTVKKSV